MALQSASDDLSVNHDLGRIGRGFWRERALGSPFRILDIPTILADDVCGRVICKSEPVRPSIDDRLTAAPAGPTGQEIEQRRPVGSKGRKEVGRHVAWAGQHLHGAILLGP